MLLRSAPKRAYATVATQAPSPLPLERNKGKVQEPRSAKLPPPTQARAQAVFMDAALLH